MQLLNFALYLKKKIAISLIFDKYKSKLITLICKKFTQQKCAIIEQHYCAAINNNCLRIFNLIKQDKYLRKQSRALKRLLNKYSKNKRKLTFVLLILMIYNIVTIIEVLSLIKYYLEIIFFKLALLFVIDYCNKTTNLAFFISKILRKTSN